MRITWWMNLGGNQPSAHDALLFLISGTGSNESKWPVRGGLELTTCQSTVNHANHQPPRTLPPSNEKRPALTVLWIVKCYSQVWVEYPAIGVFDIGDLHIDPLSRQKAESLTGFKRSRRKVNAGERYPGSWMQNTYKYIKKVVKIVILI